MIALCVKRARRRAKLADADRWKVNAMSGAALHGCASSRAGLGDLPHTRTGSLARASHWPVSVLDDCALRKAV